MRLESWALSDVGRVRTNNEDGYLVDAELGLLAVADGMGGHAGGELASAQALQSLQAHLSSRRELIKSFGGTPEEVEALRKELEHGIQLASSAVFDIGVEDPSKRGLGTTLSAILAVGSKAIMGHVGDSRVYLVRSSDLHQLSEDHSYLWERMKAGLLTPDAVPRSKFSNVITRAVGVTRTVEVDTLVFDVVPGDVLLLCSDGLHGMVPKEEDLLRLLLEGPIDQAPSRLVDTANQRGGRDNVSCIVSRVPGGADDPSTLDILERVDVLKSIPLFRHLSYPELVTVLHCTKMKTVREREYVIKEGSVAEEFFVILEGRVEVRKNDRALTRLGPRIHFGEMALVDRSPRSASVLALEPTRLLALDRKALFRLVRTEPTLSSKLLWSFVQVLSHRLRLANDKLSQGAPDEPPGPTEDIGAPQSPVVPPHEEPS
ncbi:MAG: cyclic nucleotide-binding domain-containing protein [Myxococcota bacterium]